MSLGNVEIARAATEAAKNPEAIERLAHGDMDAIDLVDPEVEWDATGARHLVPDLACGCAPLSRCDRAGLGTVAFAICSDPDFGQRWCIGVGAVAVDRVHQRSDQIDRQGEDDRRVLLAADLE